MQSVLRVASYVALLGASVLGEGAPDALGQYAGSQRIPPELHLHSDAMPAPPAQLSAWKAPATELPQPFVSATTTLFQQGLADPRGCEYRAIKVVVGGSEPPWADEIVKTHGWVIPETGQSPQRFGVCWNGLVYPLVSIGEPADLRADSRQAAKANLAPLQGITGWYFEQHYENFCLCRPSESRSVSHESPLPLKACLLLRLGEPELAKRIWDRWAVGLRSYSTERQQYLTPAESVEANKPYLDDSYVVMANCWTLALWDRAVGAHQRGDDRLALASVGKLAAAWPAVVAEAVVAEAERRGFQQSSPRARHSEPPYFLLDVDRMHVLLADQRRRENDRRRETGPPIRHADYPDWKAFCEAMQKQVGQYQSKEQRIAFLLRQLEESSTLEWLHASSFDPLLRLVNDQGEDAVEPLLACLESDTRLSRSPRMESRFPLGVYHFAEPALQAILRMPFRDSGPPYGATGGSESESRKDRAATIRTFWNRYKDQPLPERWYDILADDGALHCQWFAAAHAITQSEKFPITFDSVTASWKYRGPKSRMTSKVHGDVLRDRTDPSVTELMARRIGDLNQPYHDRLIERRQVEQQIEKSYEQPVEPPENLDEEAYDRFFERLDNEHDELTKRLAELQKVPWQTSVQGGCEMALCLAGWDPAAAQPILSEQAGLCRQLSFDGDPDRQAYGASSPEAYLVQLLLARADAGDHRALEEYASLLRQRTRTKAVIGSEFGQSANYEALLEPLWRYPEVPAIAAVAEWLLNEDGAPCDPLLDPSQDAAHNPVRWKCLSGPLIVSPAFRRQVLRLLDDRSSAVVFRLLGVTPSAGAGPFGSPSGDEGPHRVCDLYAHQLATLNGTPKCELSWPEPQRDRAVTACAAFLRQYGHRLKPSDLPPDIGSFFPREAKLTFSRLNRPAVPDDVRKGDAIFSLDGPGAVRICPELKLPLHAHWRPQKKDQALPGKGQNPPHKAEDDIRRDQLGVIWQAEEQQQPDGQWRRYYGLAVRYGLLKVPAEEIEIINGLIQ